MKRGLQHTALAALAIATIIGGAGEDGDSGAGKAPDSHPTIIGASVTERERVLLAVHRFDRAGLALPPLDIEFAGPENCTGGYGVFSSSETRWRITICSRNDWVYEHELAHAWERANLSDDLRRRFTEFFGLRSWADPGDDWNQRGVETAAVVIQQGLAGLPLSPVLNHVVTRRLLGYEMLTGRPAPLLVEWLGARSVACEARPTPLSLGVADLSGLVCVPPAAMS